MTEFTLVHPPEPPRPPTAFPRGRIVKDPPGCSLAVVIPIAFLVLGILAERLFAC